MEFEVIRNSNKKNIVIGTSIFIILGVVLIARFTFAKYELVKSIKIAEGTINYKVPDFKIMAMYKNDGNGDTSIDTMPESGYIINETKSYCTLDNINKDTKAKLFTNEEGNHVISGLSKADKCYLYFDKKVSAGETILGNITVKTGTPNFAAVATTDEGVYAANDNDGISYYFRGAVNNNYVKFANKYWRIIRINGDGTIRMIYDGTEPHVNGTKTANSIAAESKKFNALYDNNAYVGFQYTVNQLSGLDEKSNALIELETWYQNSLIIYENKIDIDAGFCGDRSPSTSEKEINYLDGKGKTYTYYGAYIRLYTNKSPILTCGNTNDLYTTSNSNKGSKSLTYPIGLISADEVSMAGGVYAINNWNFYLYNGYSYWVMTPSYFSNSGAGMFDINTNGLLTNTGLLYSSGLRPVINLRSDVTLTGNGTMDSPYIVN